jgi:hypothetical protein
MLTWMVLFAVQAWGSAAAPTARDICAGQQIPYGYSVTARHDSNACSTGGGSPDFLLFPPSERYTWPRRMRTNTEVLR